MVGRILGSMIGTLAFMSGASAQVLTPPERTTGFSPIEGKIANIQVVRVPKGEAITGLETRITFKFTLQGCLDTLMPVISAQEVQGNRVTLYVTALNAHNEGSRVANCVAMPQETAQLAVPGMFRQHQIRVIYGKASPSSRVTF